MSLSSSPLPPPSSSSSSNTTSTPTTAMRVHNLKHHYSQLGKVSKALASSSSSSSSSSHQSSATSRMTGWEYEWQICKRADAAHQSHDFFTSVNNMHLNRYTDILANEQSRVKLENYKEPINDYINANYVSCSHFAHTTTNYIATQGPTDRTVSDFWYMCFQQDASLIVMLCNQSEAGRPKCAEYWPKLSQSYQFENTHVTSGGCMTVTTTKEEYLAESNNTIIHRQLEVTLAPRSDSAPDTVYTARTITIDQLQYIEWPDHGVPSQTKNFRVLCEKCDEIRAQHSNVASPVVVHCSAGIGRTGTFMTVCILTEQMKHYLRTKQDAEQATEPFAFDIVDTVVKLKTLRRGMVQTMGQYQFAYEAILEEAESLGFNFDTMPRTASCLTM